MNFGKAIEALNEGKMVHRTGWNGKGMFVFKQVHSIIGKEIVPKMTSLPKSVKDEFEKRFNDESMQVDSICYTNQFALVNVSNLITGWSPSVSDTLAIDWEIYN